MRLSVTSRIALLSIVLALISNLAVIAFVWQRSQADAIRTVQRDATERADALQAVWQGEGEAALAAAVNQAAAANDPTEIALLVDGAGRRLAGEGPLRVIASALRPSAFETLRIATIAPWDEHDAGLVVRPLGSHRLLVGRLLLEIERQQWSLERALLLAVLVSLGLGIVGGLVVSRYVATRMTQIVGVIEAVGEGDLTRRVALEGGGGDAFDRLALRLNATLDRLERLMGELRVVTDGLAHDLRSPVARLHTRAEQAATQTDPAARDAALAGIVAETDLLMQMLSTVLEISRSETAGRDRFVDFDPAQVIEDLADLYGPVIEEAGRELIVTLDARPPPMPLHRELLGQALGNLIDNALKHGAGTLTLALGATAETIVIEVRDRGPGIREADRAEARRRFGRLDAARTTPGAGLGIALVDAVARLHGGRFELDDHRPGLIARIVLPLTQT